MIVGIHQPAYLPWLGYFDRINAVDLFIYLDTVQFQKGSFQNRNKVLTPEGPVWLTVPVKTAGKLFETSLRDLEIDQSQNWQQKHVSILRRSYAAARAFEDVMEWLAPYYRRDWLHIADLCWHMLMHFNQVLHIETPIVRASEMAEVDGRKSDLVLNLCRAVGATTYLSGSQGKDYLDTASFGEAGIEVEFQNYTPQPYPQLSDAFVPALGVVDYLFNVANPGSLFEAGKAQAIL